MRSYYFFLKANYRPVYFGWLLTFFSSFGQTFYVSIFVPSVLRDFGFTRAGFGFYYSAATLLASVFLLKIGHVIDHEPVRSFTVKTILLLAGSCLLLAGAVHPVMVFAALTGLRLGGQSLMPHISSSVMSRCFEKDRGKALSLSSLGFSSGEIAFPILAGALLVLSGWRVAMAASGGVLLLLLLPILKKLDVESMDSDSSKNDGFPPVKKLPVFLDIMKRRNFWVISFPTWFLSLTLTGMFFYQYMLAEERQWGMEWYAGCFAGFGIAKLVFLIFGGTLVDRFSARKLFPYFPIPSVLGFLALAYITGRASPAVFLPLIGITVGMSGVATAAVIAEIYGVGNIGMVRSLFTVLMVAGAAAGPVLYGLILDAGHSFRLIALSSGAVLILISMTNTLLARERGTPR